MCCHNFRITVFWFRRRLSPRYNLNIQNQLEHAQLYNVVPSCGHPTVKKYFTCQTAKSHAGLELMTFNSGVLAARYLLPFLLPIPHILPFCLCSSANYRRVTSFHSLLYTQHSLLNEPWLLSLKYVCLVLPQDFTVKQGWVKKNVWW